MKPYYFILLPLLLCSLLSVAQSSSELEIEIVTSNGISIIDSPATLQRVKSFPLLPHQHFFYHKAHSDVGVNAPASITIRNAVSKHLLDAKRDSLKRDAYKLAGTVKDRFRLHNNSDMVTVNLVYTDKRRYQIGSSLYCVYSILNGKIVKQKEIFLPGAPNIAIDSAVNSRLDSFALADNEFILHDTENYTMRLFRIMEFKQPQRDEWSVLLKIIFELLKEQFYKYYQVQVSYLDPKGLKLAESAICNIEGLHLFWYYDRLKVQYDSIYSKKK